MNPVITIIAEKDRVDEAKVHAALQAIPQTKVTKVTRWLLFIAVY